MQLRNWFENRHDDLVDIVQELGFTVGAEIGVQTGFFTERTLKQLHCVKTYLLVDV
jgi:hypothetical protein